MLNKNIWEANMKKILTAVFLTALMLCSCGRVPDRDSLMSVLGAPYDAEAAVTDDGRDYRVTISRDAEGTVRLTFTEPSALSGITYATDGGGSRIVYRDLDIPISAPAGDRVSSGAAVWGRLLSADGEYTVRNSAVNGMKTYTASDGETEYVFDRITRLPVSVKNEKTTIIFTNFRTKNDKSSEGGSPDIEGGT